MKRIISMTEFAKIIKCNEVRIYYCRHGQIPFKAKVRLYARVYFENGKRLGFFEWEGRKFCCPLGILRRVKNGQA
ncbi:hypothetical protein [Archaeoglobus profundus]|uniref:Uncharacterized protein n=1 Tax=Archaeoglobus profundus (strain DSM 5631 / JCM 9629 / NBRC 100127 / Av18) TaxID=572546 RepID=D2RF93_ARCPA|nr:hypothetical protein [Archaeoglobus profundus]ADB58787.1 hypothetical protein Arcpr_1743 [Archaeoglobus profundus DSM 5631]